MGLKIALIFILFFVCYLGLIPAYSKNCRGSQKTLSLMNCFAGGVFLAMAFMHILPESVEQYYAIMSEEETKDEGKLRFLHSATSATTIEEAAPEARIFPFPYLLFFAGYGLVLLFDRVLAGEHGHSHANHEESDKVHHHDDHEHSHKKEKELIVEDVEHAFAVSPAIKPVIIGDLKDDLKVAQEINEYPTIKNTEIKKKDSGEISRANLPQNDDAKVAAEKDLEIHGHPAENQVLICGVNITPLILLLALGIHSIFEGIALGMSKSISVFVNLMIGVTLHHAAACISLGVSLG